APSPPRRLIRGLTEERVVGELSLPAGVCVRVGSRRKLTDCPTLQSQYMYGTNKRQQKTGRRHAFYRPGAAGLGQRAGGGRAGPALAASAARGMVGGSWCSWWASVFISRRSRVRRQLEMIRQKAVKRRARTFSSLIVGVPLGLSPLPTQKAVDLAPACVGFVQ